MRSSMFGRVVRYGILCCLWPALVSVSPGAEDGDLRVAVDRQIDVQHIQLDLNVNLPQQSVEGVATIVFQPLQEIGRTITLDAVGLEIQSVTATLYSRTESRWETVPAQFTTGRESLDVICDLGGPGADRSFSGPGEGLPQLTIRYRVRKPQAGLYFFGPTPDAPETPLTVWSQGEPRGSRYWFPCVDQPIEQQTTTLRVTVPSGLEVLSNGKLIAREDVSDDRTPLTRYVWKQDKPHATYLTSLVVGDFAVAEDTWRGRPVTYYVPERRAADLQRTFGRTTEMLEFFSERFGIEYPWDKYAQVVVEQFIWGGMENTSAATLYERALHDERAMVDSTPDWLIAHELGHQWWGDLVTCRHWSHLWLNEGFATYSEILWAEHRLGAADRDWRLFEKSRSARSGTALTRPIVDRSFPHPASMFDVRAYPKGGWVLHMLRRRLGDAEFFRGLKRYGTVYAFQTAETTDLRRTFERLYGISLERFFHDWTERPGHPELQVDSHYDADRRELQVDIEQTQKDGWFEIPVRVACAVEDSRDRRGYRLVTQEWMMSGRKLTMSLKVPDVPLGVSIDPDFSLLATVRERKANQFWEWQLRNPLNVAEAVRAIEHYAADASDQSREILRDTLLTPPDNHASHYGVRVEAAKALGKLKGDPARDALLAGLDDQVPQVRRACAEALARFKRDDEVIAALKDRQRRGDISYPTEAAVLSSLCQVLPDPPRDILIASLEKNSHREVIRIAALGQLAKRPDDRSFEILFEWTSRDRPDVCRARAIAALAESVVHNERSEKETRRVVEHLLELLASEGPRHRAAVVTALGSLGHRAQSATEALRRIASDDPSDRTRDAAEAALIRVQSAPAPGGELQKLRRELETQRRRLDELTDRLESIQRADGKSP